MRNSPVEDWSCECYDSQVFHASAEILLLRVYSKRVYSTRTTPFGDYLVQPQYAMSLWRLVQWLNVLCMKSWTWLESKSISSYMRSSVRTSCNLKLGIPTIWQLHFLTIFHHVTSVFCELAVNWFWPLMWCENYCAANNISSPHQKAIFLLLNRLWNEAKGWWSCSHERLYP